MPKASVNGINIYYETQGQGEPLVLITGLGGAHRDWFFQTRFFKKYLLVIPFDNRGVGNTEKPIGPYTVKMMAEDTIGLMDHLNINKAHILGASFGGLIAQEVAITHPERVRKLVLASTFARWNEMGGLSSDLMKGLGIEEGCSEQDARNIRLRKFADVLIPLSFNGKLYRTIFIPLSKVSFKFLDAKALIAQLEAVLSHDSLDRLHLIKAPTLVITGDEDRLIAPYSSEVLASRIPNAKLVKVERGPHAIPLEKRDRFNREVLDFLRGS